MSFKLDEGGDLDFSGGQIGFINGDQNVAQWMDVVLDTAPGEYVWDTQVGFPRGKYVDHTIGAHQQAELVNDLNTALLYSPYIQNLSQVSITPGDRTTVKITAVSINNSTISGQVTT